MFKKKCPKCGSENIESCGVGRSNPAAISDEGTLPEVNKWQYQCLHCETRFHIVN